MVLCSSREIVPLICSEKLEEEPERAAEESLTLPPIPPIQYQKLQQASLNPSTLFCKNSNTIPNANTNTGNAFIGLATDITGTFVFTSYGTDAGNVFVTVSR